MKDVPKNSKERAAEYKTSHEPAPVTPESAAAEPANGASEQKPKQPKTKSEQQWRDLVSQRVEEAIQQGAFENLPGRGQPLNLRRNPFVPEDKEMAFNLLENNGMAPPWIMERQAIQNDIDKLRNRMQQAAAQHRAQFEGADEKTRAQWQWSWEQHLVRWREEIEALNKRINTLNLSQPIAHLELYKLRLEDEMARVGM